MIHVSRKMIERIIDNAEIEFRGCHAPHKDTPLYGRKAYFMVDDCKITFPVKSINPRTKTLREGLINELKRRVEAIKLCVDVSWSGCMRVVKYDPYSVERLFLKYNEGQNLDLPYRSKKD